MVPSAGMGLASGVSRILVAMVGCSLIAGCAASRAVVAPPAEESPVPVTASTAPAAKDGARVPVTAAAPSEGKGAPVAARKATRARTGARPARKDAIAAVRSPVKPVAAAMPAAAAEKHAPEGWRRSWWLLFLGIVAAVAAWLAIRSVRTGRG